MFSIRYVTDFDAAHRLYEYEGKCARTHGHTWKVEVVAKTDRLDDTGMVCDFFELRELVDAVIAPFDHVDLCEVPPFDRLSPTSEALARHIFEELSAQVSSIDDGRVSLAEVKVWESSTTWASYSSKPSIPAADE